MSPPLSVGIVGSGILGLAYAWSAARRGGRVTVYERHPRAVGASVRNFGMIWPIGQPHGEPYRIALAAREAWLELGRDAGIAVEPCGSLHLAYRSDEWQVIREFADAAGDLGVRCSTLSGEEASRLSPIVNPAGLIGALHSPTELRVDPRTAIGRIAQWLAGRFGVEFRFSTPVTGVEPGQLTTADGVRHPHERLIVCGGADVELLFPGIGGEAGLRRCKLQMLRTVAQPADLRIGPHLASGLTLRHYRSFEICPSLDKLRQRIAAETPELDRYGIHVMASQNEAGSLILGDSHEYDADIEPFDKAIIDDLILRELRPMLRLRDWTVEQRWHGVYTKHPNDLIFRSEPAPGVFIRTAAGGAGMTLAFGLAEADSS